MSGHVEGSTTKQKFHGSDLKFPLYRISGTLYLKSYELPSFKNSFRFKSIKLHTVPIK